MRLRVKDLKHVPKGELLANPANHRRHPPKQMTHLRTLFGSVGIAAPLVAYHSPRSGGALVLIDGHARLEVLGENRDATVPVVILDVTDGEADLLLAGMDSIADMAEIDTEALRELLANVEEGHDEDEAPEGLLELLEELRPPPSRDRQVYEWIDDEGEKQTTEVFTEPSRQGSSPAATGGGTSVPSRIPLFLALSPEDNSRWLAWRDRCGEVSDDLAFSKLLREVIE